MYIKRKQREHQLVKETILRIKQNLAVPFETNSNSKAKFYFPLVINRHRFRYTSINKSILKKMLGNSFGCIFSFLFSTHSLWKWYKLLYSPLKRKWKTNWRWFLDCSMLLTVPFYLSFENELIIATGKGQPDLVMSEYGFK